MVLIFVAFAIRTSWFQTFLAQQVASYLSGEWQTEVQIEKVNIVFFDLVDIEGVYVEDKVKDTLLFSELLQVNIADFSLSESFVDIEEVELTNATVNIKKYKNDTTLNFQHIIDYFASSEEDTTSADPFTVKVQKVALNNVNFVYQDQNATPSEFGLDYSNLSIRNLSGEFSEFGLEGDELTATIKDLQFKERSGLVLSKFSSEVLYSPRRIALNNLRLGFNNSLVISDKLELNTPNGSEDFADFVNKVNFNGNLRDTKLELTDVAYFVPSIHGMDNRVNLNNVVFSGPVYGMRLSKVDITMLDSTIVRGEFQIPNMDDPEEAFLDERITHFQTTISDVKRIKLTPFLGGPDYIELPESTNNAGLVELKNGHLTGTLNDFVVDGDLYSGLGNVYSQHGLKFKKEDGVYTYYSANNDPGRDVEIVNLDLAALTGNDVLGITSGYITIGKGSKGLNMDELDLRFTGEFTSVELNGYDYQNIIIKEGRFSNNVFDGVIDVKDDNLALNYDGSVNLNGDMKFDFDVVIDTAYLSKLYESKEGLEERFKSKINVNITGTSLNEMSGTVKVDNLAYKEGEIDFYLDSLTLNIARNEESDSIIIHSELLDLELTGKFDLTDMWPVVQHQLARVADHVIDDVDISRSQNEFFDLKIDLKNVNPLMQFTGHEVYIAEDSKVRSSYNLDSLKLTVDINSELVLYDGMAFQDIELRNYFDSLRANVHYQIGGVKVSDSLEVKNAALFSYVRDNEFSTNIGWDGSGDIEPALFAFNTHLKENQDILTEFKPSFFFLKSHRWKISPDSKLLWNHEILEFTDFDIRNGDHLVNLEGKVSKDPKDWLYFQVRDFDLTDLNGILGGAVTIGGILNVDGGVSDVYNNIRFMSLSDIKDFVVDGELVGDLLVDNKWNKEKQSVIINGNLKRESKETFKFSGNYFTELEKDNLDLDLVFDYTDIGFLNAFSDPELYTDIEGLLNGKLKITGELTDPVINGKLDVVTANVMVPMFNVSFGISGGINFGPDEIIVDFMNVYDQEGNNAIASMQIYHYNWVDWNYDITLDMQGPFVSDRFLVMDTYYKDGDFYYGKAYISGDVNIFGYDDITEITVNATTEQGTDIKLAMYGSGDLEESSFVVFDTIVPTFSTDALNDDGTKIETTGLVMNMNFDITKDTKATIVFDPIYEDQIEVDAGEGNITLNVDEYGEMDMYGKYTILEGAYYMRVKGLVSKDFVIRNGSNLVWTKSPYDAIIDINADYLTNISLEPILPPGIEDRSGDKEDVIATLHMGRTLMNPNISFKITAPNADDIGKTALKSIQADQDHLNKQFFSVLALNKFLPTNGGGGSSGSAAIDFAENQINAILDNVGDNYDIAAELDNGKTALGFETQVGEKVTIKTSLGVVAGGEETTGGLIGDIIVEYRLNEDGTFTVNAFNESNQGSEASEKGPFTQGVGLHYEETFNKWEQSKLVQGFLNIFRSKENDVDYKTEKSNGKKKSVKEALDERNAMDNGNSTEEEGENENE